MASSSPRVVLIGPPASGKTKIGKLVARSLSEPLVDTDALLVARYGAIADIFRDHGEPWFRSREAEVVQEALTGPGVVSLGGGAVITASTRQALTGHPVVGLSISEDAVSARVGNKKRPLLVDGIDSWKALVASRQHWYDEVADITIEVSHRPLEQLAQEIVDWLGSRNG